VSSKSRSDKSEGNGIGKRIRTELQSCQIEEIDVAADTNLKEREGNAGVCWGGFRGTYLTLVEIIKEYMTLEALTSLNRELENMRE
jgi:hypothetical protein